MKLFKHIIFLAIAFNWNFLNTLAQSTLTESDLVGNWTITSGSGPDFDKEMIGGTFTFEQDHKVSRIEEGETMVSNWKMENNVITVTYYYNDGKNEPEIETLTIISFDGKKLKVKYDYYEDDDNFDLILEKKKMP